MDNLIIIILLIIIVGGAIVYIYKEKKKGVKCIGCPFAQNCSKKNCSSNYQ